MIMIRNIIKFFSRKRRKSHHKMSSLSVRASSSEKKANILPFVTTLKKGKKIETEETEQARIYKIAIELTDNFKSIAQKSFLDMGKCYYIFLFRTLQSMVWQLSFPVYRHYLESVRKQIVRNHKNLLNRFKEWETSPDERLIGERKSDNENDTIH